jgi:serine-type D-Ala-D-Ala carboxypeptidase/endopeptidase
MKTPNILSACAFLRRSLSTGPALLAGNSRIAAPLALSATLLVSLLPAQQPISLAEADQRGQQIYRQSGSTGMVLVVVRGRETMIRTYGETAPGTGQKPQSNSEVRLCSISKIFATDLLAQLVSQGKLALDDPLQRYAPQGKVVPEFTIAQPITLRDLATHTASLPREVSSYPRNTPHFTFPGYAYRWNWLPKQTIKAAPGTTAVYSNIGFDLLGDALASATGESYAHLLHDNLLQPLQMWDTTLAPSADQCARLLRGAQNQGPCTDTQPSGASGGIYSTPTDMVKFLGYLLRVSGSPAPPAGALDVFMEPDQLKSIQGLSHAGNPTGIGLGWIQIGDPATPSAIMEKTGGGAGFTTYIALNPRSQTGVFLAITWGKGDATIDFFHEGNNILAALANIPPLPAKAHVARPAKRHLKTAVKVHPKAHHAQPKTGSSKSSARTKHRPTVTRKHTPAR